MFGLEVIRGASAHVTLARTSRVALPYSCGLTIFLFPHGEGNWIDEHV